MKLTAFILFLFATSIVLSQDLVPYRDQKLWGYADQTGKIVIEPQYEKTLPFWKNGLAKIMKSGNYYLINAKNEIKTTEGYTEIFEFSNGLAAVCKGGEFSVMQGEIVNGKWGYINEINFTEVIPANYARAESFHGNYAIVQTGSNWGNWGVIDKNGKQILPFNYTTYSFDMRPFPGIIWHDASTKLEVDISGNGNLWNLIDIKGLKISGPVENYHGMNKTSPDDAKYELLKKAKKNKESQILAANYILKTSKGDYTSTGYVTAIETGIYLAEVTSEDNKNKFGIIDEKNNILIPFEYDAISTNISEGLVSVVKNSKYGFCDLKGNEIVQCMYEMVDPFVNGIARVYLSRKDYSYNSTGYINKAGIEFFRSDPVYQITYNKDKKYIVTDQYFNPVAIENLTYDDIRILNGKYFLATKHNSAILYNSAGQILAEGTAISELTNSCVLVSQDKHQKLFNYTGNMIIVDSIHHITSKISDPVSLKLFGYTYLKNDKFGLVTMTDKALLPAKYEFIQFTGAYLILKDSKNQFAICDTNNKMIRAFSIETIGYLSKDLFTIQSKTSNEIYDARTNKTSNLKIKLKKTSNFILPGVFENDKGLVGYINTTTQEILQPVYKSYSTVKMFDEHFIPVDLIRFLKTDLKYDIYNTQTGKIIITDAEGFDAVQGRMLPVRFGRRYYFYDDKGTKIFETGYESINSVLSDGYTAAKLHGKWGIIDRENKPVIDFKYDYITNMVDDIIIYEKDEKYGLLDISDSILVQPQYQGIEYVSKQTNDTVETTYYFLAELSNPSDPEKPGKKGIIDQKNKTISPFELEGESDFPFSGDVFLMMKNEKPVLFNYQGKMIISGNYDEILPIEIYDPQGNQFVQVKKGNKIGLFHIDGKPMLYCVYDKINESNDFYDLKDRSYFTMEQNGKTGLACNTGEIILDANFDKLENFFGDDVSYQRIKQNGKYGLYRDFRKKLSDCVYENIAIDEESVYRNVFIVKASGKYGLIDSAGKVLAPAIYNKLEQFEYDNDEIMFEIIQNSKKGLMNKEGKIIIPPLFDKIEPIYDVDNLGFYTYKNKLIGVYGHDGKEVLECKFVKTEYSDDDRYSMFFITKEKEYWGITYDGKVEKLDR